MRGIQYTLSLDDRREIREIAVTRRDEQVINHIGALPRDPPGKRL